ncbi:metallophosphoesterase [Deinococcus aquaedulcis]|uniref:metallophosphoesterase n=1 Tax=Deinococcus aquaedulcis TaxID=2840455 RepID=UPI001F42CDA0|nr:metallophosphoesterase [Deinococcus aquaedulcis]
MWNDVRRAMGVLLVGSLVACAPAVTGSPDPGLNAPRVALEAGRPERLRLVVMGDQGTGTDIQRRVAQGMAAVCAAQGCDLGAALGDNFYPAGPKEATSPLFRERFEELYGALGIPFVMVLGNHDESWLWGGDGADPRGAAAQVAYSRLNPQWVMPGRQYQASVGGLLDLFVVDTAPLAAYLPSVQPQERPGGPWDAAQRAWLARSVAQSAARWRLVLGHHPLYSNGKHGDAGAYDNLPFAFQRGGAVRELYKVACSQADLLLSGHDHALQVFAPQPDCPGTWTAVSGAAGEVGGSRRGTRSAAFEVYGQPGFLWLDITPETLTIRAYTVGEGGAVTMTEAARLTRRP